jgi:hypothetical protein
MTVSFPMLSVTESMGKETVMSNFDVCTGWHWPLLVHLARGLKGLVMLVLASQLAACAAALTAYPERPSEATMSYSKINRRYQEDILQQYYLDSMTDEKRKIYRNLLVEGRLIEIDHFFHEFEQSLYRGGVGLGLATDWATLGLNAAGALTGGTVLKSVLAGTSAAIIGGKAAFDKRAMFDATVPSLLAKMRAQRKQTLVQIFRGLASGVDQYPLSVALQDLATYYNAGTLPGALIGIQLEAGESAKVADSQIQLFFDRPKEFVRPSVQKRIDAIAAALEDRTKVSDNQVLDLANKPPVSGIEFTKMLEQFRAGQLSFTNATVARFALAQAVIEMERSDANLSAWEQRLGLTQRKS